MTCLPVFTDPPGPAPEALAGPGPTIATWAATAAVRALACRCAAHAGADGGRWAGLTLVVAEAGAFCLHQRGYTRLVEPGGVVVGLGGDAYACTHAYGGGDACRVLQFAPAAEDDLARARGRALLAGGVLAQDPALVGRLAAARRAPTPLAFEEAAHGLALAAVAALDGVAPQVPPSWRRADRDRAHAAAAYVEAHHAQDVALADLAGHVGLSPFHFLRVFRQELGLTPHQHLVRTRLRHAVRLLADTDLPVTEVAYASGFGDLSHFLRAFRRAMGRPPGAFRRALPPAGGGQPRRAPSALDEAGEG